MANEVLNEEQSANTSETNKDTAESDDYYTFEGVEYRDINKIDITTNQGKFEWLDSLVENSNARLENEQDNIMREEGLYGMDAKEREEYLEYNDAYQDNKRSLENAKRQRKIMENLDIDGDGGILGALERKRNALYEAANNSSASSEAQEAAFKNWNATADLYLLLSGEMARRDPQYFGQEEMSRTLELEVAQAEKQVEQTMVDGYFGEDGFIHKAPNGEKTPSTATEDAEIDLKYAKQDAETFILLINDYQAANDYAAPRAIKKEDFAPTIDKFIDNHTTQLNQLMTESKTMAKGTPEYIENEAKRKKLASERSSAKRLVARYFNVPKPESASSPTIESDADDGMSMKQMPAVKTEEQTKTEVRERQEEQSPTSYRFEGGIVDKDAMITVGQEIPDEWFKSKTYEDSTGNEFGISIARPPRIEDYLFQALNIEFGKLPEDERQHYDYSTLFKAIMAEATRTKRVPNIANIINRQRAINEQLEKVEQSYGRGASQQINEELEDEMSM